MSSASHDQPPVPHLSATRAANASGYVEEYADRHLFRVHRGAFVENGILTEEYARIFNKCWLYLGHESELPNPCDYLTRSVGGRELIFNRDRTGKHHAFLNSCPHRGAMLAREAKG